MVLRISKLNRAMKVVSKELKVELQLLLLVDDARMVWSISFILH